MPKLLALFCLFFVLFKPIFVWKTSTVMNKIYQNIKSNDFRDYFIQKTFIFNQEYLIIFGGYSLENNSKKVYNNLYRINLLTEEVFELAAGKLKKPSERYGVCGIIVRDRLIIYGGNLSNHTLATELWQYRFASNEWFNRGNFLQIQKCGFMITSNVEVDDTVTLVGLLSADRSFYFVQYLFLNQNFVKNCTVINYSSIKLTETLWDGTIAASYLRHSSQNDKIGKTVTEYPEMKFSIKYFCLILAMENKYHMITNDGIYKISKKGMTYQIEFSFEKSVQGTNNPFNCLSVNDWFFVISGVVVQNNASLYSIIIEFMNSKTLTGGIIHNNKPALSISWIPFVEFYSCFAYSNAIYIISEHLDTYYLSQNCSDQIAYSPHLLRCVFGMYSCKEGWTGVGCKIYQCGGSLKILDANNLTLIFIECSGNGVCTEKGCLCDQNWAGEICDIYEKKNCKGTLINNFISKNCQCSEPTTGGNQCTVIFCYNDCSGHGTCQQSGQCSCDEGYTGPDCSILEIDFNLLK